MVEDKIRIINDLDIQIKELKEIVKKMEKDNDDIKANIQQKLLLISQLTALLNQIEMEN